MTKVTRDEVDFIVRPLLAGTFIGVTVDNAPIGQTTPNVGFFTNLTAANLTITSGANIVGATITATSLTVTGSANFTGATVTGLETAGTLTDGATINWNLSRIQVATVTLGGNRTMAAPTGLSVGTFILVVKQDATGGRTLTWNSVFKWPGSTAPVLSTTSTAIDIFFFYCDGTKMYGLPNYGFG